MPPKKDSHLKKCNNTGFRNAGIIFLRNTIQILHFSIRMKELY